MSEPETWLRGPIEGVPPLLMPVAHALIQAGEDVERALAGLPGDALWLRPAGAASIGFHVQHIAGVVDRLFTYARGQALSEAQLASLRTEGAPGEGAESAAALIATLRQTLAAALEQLRGTHPGALLEARGVGRQQLPSNVIGLLFHAAEHAQRHVGQLLVTARVVQDHAAR